MDAIRITQKTVVEQVMAHIKSLIASGQFGVNTRLPSEKELSEMFGVARTSIREALKIFTYLGVMKSKAGVGTYVCERANISKEALTWAILLGKSDFYEMIELRRIIEVDGLFDLLESSKQDGESARRIIESLEGELENIRLAVEQSDIARITEADYRFHGLIISASNNSLFTGIYDTLRSFMYEEIRMSMTPHLPTIYDLHHQILASIKQGDPIEARKILEDHIGFVIKAIEKKRSMDDS